MQRECYGRNWQDPCCTSKCKFWVECLREFERTGQGRLVKIDPEWEREKIRGVWYYYQGGIIVGKESDRQGLIWLLTL